MPEKAVSYLADSKNSNNPNFELINGAIMLNHGEDYSGKSSSITNLQVGKKYVLYLAYINSSTYGGGAAEFPTLSQTMDTKLLIFDSSIGYSPGTQYRAVMYLCKFTATSSSLTISTNNYSGARWVNASVISY